jgi:hypothetical protein
VRRLGLALSIVLFACGEATPLAPVELPPSGVGDSGASDAQNDGNIDAGAVIRTVELRNPFGNTTLIENFLVDGDFELTAGQGQFGWRSISNAGEVVLARETGGLCRSGVSCGVLESRADFVAFGAAPPDADLEVSLWAKPPVPDCGLVSVSVISCSSLFVQQLAAVLPVGDEPDSAGWCRYQGVAPKMLEQPCLYLSTSIAAEQRVLIDEAYLTSARAAAMRRLAATVPTPALLARIEHALRWIHEHKKFGRARPQNSERVGGLSK